MYKMSQHSSMGQTRKLRGGATPSQIRASLKRSRSKSGPLSFSKGFRRSLYRNTARKLAQRIAMPIIKEHKAMKRDMRLLRKIIEEEEELDRNLEEMDRKIRKEETRKRKEEMRKKNDELADLFGSLQFK